MAQPSEGQLRQTQLSNFGWKFHYGEIKDAHLTTFDDASWCALDLPHHFQFELPWDETGDHARGFKAMGEGWCRKSFKANADWKGKKVWLDFEGIIFIGDLWINGNIIGSTDYGYMCFDFYNSKHIN